MSAPSTEELLRCCVDAARAAGHHALASRGRRGEVTKRDAHDVKLALDVESQRKAEEVIRGAYPHHAMLGEEGGAMGDGREPLWIIDPIDGTVNYSHGLPLWCSSVAVQVEGKTVAGAVLVPVLNDLYTARIDGPAFKNGEPIHVSRVHELSLAVALTGLEKNFDQHVSTLDVVRTVARRVQKIRLLGAAALDLCLVACGQAEAFFEMGVHLWDVAAAGLIAERAGGRAEVLQQLGGTRMRYLCTNGLIHDELRGIITEWLEQKM